MDDPKCGMYGFVAMIVLLIIIFSGIGISFVVSRFL